MEPSTLMHVTRVFRDKCEDAELIDFISQVLSTDAGWICLAEEETGFKRFSLIKAIITPIFNWLSRNGGHDIWQCRSTESQELVGLSIWLPPEFSPDVTLSSLVLTTINDLKSLGHRSETLEKISHYYMGSEQWKCRHSLNADSWVLFYSLIFDQSQLVKTHGTDIIQEIQNELIRVPFFDPSRLFSKVKTISAFITDPQVLPLYFHSGFTERTNYQSPDGSFLTYFLTVDYDEDLRHGLFTKLDKNKNGFLRLEELKEVIEFFLDFSPSVPLVSQLADSFAEDKEKVTFDEFSLMVQFVLSIRDVFLLLFSLLTFQAYNTTRRDSDVIEPTSLLGALNQVSLVDSQRLTTSSLISLLTESESNGLVLSQFMSLCLKIRATSIKKSRSRATSDTPSLPTALKISKKSQSTSPRKKSEQLSKTFCSSSPRTRGPIPMLGHLNPPVVEFLRQDEHDSFIVTITANEGLTVQKKVGKEGEWKQCNKGECEASATTVTYFRCIKHETVSEEVSKGPVFNVMMIGTTGVGKSRWATYLSTLGKTKLFAHADAKNTTSCTQEIAAHTVQIDDKMILRVIDTPGLNEGDPWRDFHHMSNIFKFLQHPRTLSGVMFCLPFDFKLDAQTQTTLSYYKELLSPIFSSSNVFVILTKLSEETYEEINQVPGAFQEALKEKLDAVNDFLKLSIDVIESVDSFPIKDKVLSECLRGEFKDKMRYRTYEARMRLLELILRVTPHSFSPTHRFLLPPQIERHKNDKILELKAALKQLSKSLRQQDNAAGELMDRLSEQEESERRLNSEIVTRERTISKLLGIQYTPSQYESGETWLNFKKKVLTFTIPISSESCSYKPEVIAWNCTVDHKSERKGTYHVIECTIKPNKMTLRSKAVTLGQHDPSLSPQKNWFARVRISWDGHDSFQKQAAVLKENVEELKNQFRGIVAHRQEIEQEYHRVNQANEGYREKKSKMDKRLEFLEQRDFEFQFLHNLEDQIKSDVEKPLYGKGKAKSSSERLGKKGSPRNASLDVRSSEVVAQNEDSMKEKDSIKEKDSKVETEERKNSTRSFQSLNSRLEKNNSSPSLSPKGSSEGVSSKSLKKTEVVRDFTSDKKYQRSLLSLSGGDAKKGVEIPKSDFPLRKFETIDEKSKEEKDTSKKRSTTEGVQRKDSLKELFRKKDSSPSLGRPSKSDEGLKSLIRSDRDKERKDSKSAKREENKEEKKRKDSGKDSLSPIRTRKSSKPEAQQGSSRPRKGSGSVKPESLSPRNHSDSNHSEDVATPVHQDQQQDPQPPQIEEPKPQPQIEPQPQHEQPNLASNPLMNPVYISGMNSNRMRPIVRPEQLPEAPTPVPKPVNPISVIPMLGTSTNVSIPPSPTITPTSPFLTHQQALLIQQQLMMNHQNQFTSSNPHGFQTNPFSQTILLQPPSLPGPVMTPQIAQLMGQYRSAKALVFTFASNELARNVLVPKVTKMQDQLRQMGFQSVPEKIPVGPCCSICKQDDLLEKRGERFLCCYCFSILQELQQAQQNTPKFPVGK